MRSENSCHNFAMDSRLVGEGLVRKITLQHSNLCKDPHCCKTFKHNLVLVISTMHKHLPGCDLHQGPELRNIILKVVNNSECAWTLCSNSQQPIPPHLQRFVFKNVSHACTGQSFLQHKFVTGLNAGSSHALKHVVMHLPTHCSAPLTGPPPLWSL